MKKSYLVGAIASPLAGLLLWKLLFPRITGLDGVFLFLLGGFCLWSAAACPLGLLTPQSSPGWRWAYGGVFLALFFVQLIPVFTDSSLYTLADIFLLCVIYLIQQQERRRRDD